MSWSPSSELLVKKDGIHCINCSEEKPRMAQLVIMATNTITLITSNHTPMSLDLQGEFATSNIYIYTMAKRELI